MLKLTLNEAIVKIKLIVARKSVWGTAMLIPILNETYGGIVLNKAGEVVLGQTLHNFECLVRDQHLTSIGRKQFNTWFDAEILKQTGNSIIVEKPIMPMISQRTLDELVEDDESRRHTEMHDNRMLALSPYSSISEELKALKAENITLRNALCDIRNMVNKII